MPSWRSATGPAILTQKIFALKAGVPVSRGCGISCTETVVDRQGGFLSQLSGLRILLCCVPRAYAAWQQILAHLRCSRKAMMGQCDWMLRYLHGGWKQPAASRRLGSESICQILRSGAMQEISGSAVRRRLALVVAPRGSETRLQYLGWQHRIEGDGPLVGEVFRQK